MLRLIAVLLSSFALMGQPRRIVSTAPSITEMLFALGLGRKVVGVSTYCRYPPEARRIAKVGTFLQPDLERIVALQPDLVLTLKNPVQLTERMRSLQLNAVETDPEGIDKIYASLRTIGAAAGVSKEAERLVASLQAQMAEIQKSTQKLPARSIMFFVGRTPGTLDGLVAAGRGSYLDELLAAAGGRNALADSPIPYPKVTLEQVLARDPDVILDMGDAAHADGATAEQLHEAERLWAQHTQLRAVRNQEVHAVASDIFVVPGPRFVDAVREFRRFLHPEVKP